MKRDKEQAYKRRASELRDALIEGVTGSSRVKKPRKMYGVSVRTEYRDSSGILRSWEWRKYYAEERSREAAFEAESRKAKVSKFGVVTVRRVER